MNKLWIKQMRKILLPHTVRIYIALYHGKDFDSIFLLFYILMFVVATNYKYATAWLLARVVFTWWSLVFS